MSQGATICFNLPVPTVTVGEIHIKPPVCRGEIMLAAAHVVADVSVGEMHPARRKHFAGKPLPAVEFPCGRSEASGMELAGLPGPLVFARRGDRQQPRSDQRRPLVLIDFKFGVFIDAITLERAAEPIGDARAEKSVVMFTLGKIDMGELRASAVSKGLSRVEHHSLKAPILWCLGFFMVCWGSRVIRRWGRSLHPWK